MAKPRKKLVSQEEVNELLKSQEEALRSEMSGGLTPGILATAEEDDIDQLGNMASVLSGEGAKGASLYLYRASEKSRTHAHAFLKIYQTGMSSDEIAQDVQDEFGKGDYVFLLKDSGNVIRGKWLFSVGADSKRPPLPLSPAGAVGTTYDRQLERLTAVTEKRLILDKLDEMAKGGGGKEDGSMSVMAIMMKTMMETNTVLLQTLLDSRKSPERSSMSEVVEIFKLGLNMGQGKPIDDSEDSITDTIMKALPHVVEMLKEGRRTPGTPALPASAPPGRTPPPPPAVLSPVPGSVERTIMNRIIEEVLFCLHQPETERIYAHVVDYTENYLPGSVDEMLAQSEDAYIEFVTKLHPAFAEKESFFRNLYRFVKREYGEESPGQNSPEGVQE